MFALIAIVVAWILLCVAWVLLKFSVYVLAVSLLLVLAVAAAIVGLSGRRGRGWD